jgi:hypothetical protein
MDQISSIYKARTGRWLAHNKLSLIERAFVAAELVTGECQLVQPTMTQAARLARVNVCYAHYAVQRQAERELIEHGACPLVPSPLRVLPKPTEPTLPVPSTAPATPPVPSVVMGPRERLDAIVAEIGLSATLDLLAANEKIAA